MGPITHRPMLNCETNSKYCRCDHTAETVGDDETNLFYSFAETKRSSETERSVRSPVVTVAWTTSALRTSRCCCFWPVLARDLGQTRDRGVPGQSASVELISAIAILRLHLQSQVVRPVTQISFGRRAQTDTTDRRCADVMKRETPRLRHGTVRRSVGPATRVVVPWRLLSSTHPARTLQSRVRGVLQAVVRRAKSDSLQQSATFSAVKLCSQHSRANELDSSLRPRAAKSTSDAAGISGGTKEKLEP